MTLQRTAAARLENAPPRSRPQLVRRMRVQGAPRVAPQRIAAPASSGRTTVGVLRDDGTSTGAMLIALAVDHAEILAPQLDVEVGDVVWLVLELGRGRPYTVVLTCSVSDVENERIGLCFTGLPEDEVEGHRQLGGWSEVDDQAAVVL